MGIIRLRTPDAIHAPPATVVRLIIPLTEEDGEEIRRNGKVREHQIGEWFVAHAEVSCFALVVIDFGSCWIIKSKPKHSLCRRQAETGEGQLEEEQYHTGQKDGTRPETRQRSTNAL